MRNQAMIQFFEWYCSPDGQHWNHFAREVEKLQSLGLTAAWLPPAYKGTRGDLSPGFRLAPDLEHGILREDLPVEIAQLMRRLDAELFIEQSSQPEL